MKKHELKDYNRLLRAENEALKYILQEAEDSLSDGCRCGEIKLLQEENNELLDDLNDLQADWAESNVVAGTAMWGFREKEILANNDNHRLRSVIKMLESDLTTANKRIKRLKEKAAE